MVIDPDKMRIEELVDSILDSGDDLSKYYANIDDEIYSLCWERGVLTADVPVDSNGRVTSLPLALCATYYGIYRICLGYRGSGGGDPDDVYSKASKDYLDLYKSKKSQITKDVIMGGISKEVPLSRMASCGFFQI